MKKVVFLIIASLWSGVSLAATLDVHIRNRPPDLILYNGEQSGPLKEILQVAARRSGHYIRWVPASFKRSLEDLKTASVDIVPRTFMREERKEFIHYLDPIGYQQRDVVFFVKKGNEGILKSYSDLSKVSIGVKRGSVYFETFDKDVSLKKVESAEDESLARMLKGERFDVLITTDPLGLVEQFEQIGFDYAFTDYKHENRIGLYYATSKKRYEEGSKPVYDDINRELQKMVKSGEVNTIYGCHLAPGLTY